jgi:hypothetical protein
MSLKQEAHTVYGWEDVTPAVPMSFYTHPETPLSSMSRPLIYYCGDNNAERSLEVQKGCRDP